MIKALFLDIDGTLVSFETHRVGEPTRNALAEARRRGLLLFIATGRHRCDLNNLGDLAFDGYVTLNGQYCYDARGVIYRRSIDPNDIRTAVGLIEREPFPCLFIEEDRMYINCADDNFRAAQRLLNFGDPPVESPVPGLAYRYLPAHAVHRPRARAVADGAAAPLPVDAVESLFHGCRARGREQERRYRRDLPLVRHRAGRNDGFRRRPERHRDAAPCGYRSRPWAMRPRRYRRRPTT